MTRFYSHAHINPATMDAADDTDTHKDWLFDGPDARLAEYARHRLPDSLLAKMARAYFQHAENDMDGILADSREEFEDDMRTAREL